MQISDSDRNSVVPTALCPRTRLSPALKRWAIGSRSSGDSLGEALLLHHGVVWRAQFCVSCKAGDYRRLRNVFFFSQCELQLILSRKAKLQRGQSSVTAFAKAQRWAKPMSRKGGEPLRLRSGQAYFQYDKSGGVNWTVWAELYFVWGD